MVNVKQNGVWVLRIMSRSTIVQGELDVDDFVFTDRDEVDGFLNAFRAEAKAEGTDFTNAYWLLGPITSGMNINEAPGERLDKNGRG